VSGAGKHEENPMAKEVMLETLEYMGTVLETQDKEGAMESDCSDSIDNGEHMEDNEDILTDFPPMFVYPGMWLR
jgi:hypothetical protein